MLDFSQFHFLRPLWLLGIAGALALVVLVRRRHSLEMQWKGIIAPHLLSHLKVGTGGRFGVRPVDAVAFALVLLSIAVAGPSWEREPSPFVEDTSPLVIAVDLSLSMDAIDVAPTRLERAKQKIRDLLKQRKGARTGLLVYAGSAHMVLPPTDDPAVLETFVTELATNIMPVPGKDPAGALALADEMLSREETPGTILFVTDGIPKEHFSAFVDHKEQSPDQVMILGVGTSKGGPVMTAEGRFATDAAGRRIVAKLDVEGLKTLADEAGVWVATVTVDEEDVERLQRGVQSHLQSAISEDENARWKDAGYWLIWPVMLLALAWFRKGWTVRWES